MSSRGERAALLGSWVGIRLGLGASMEVVERSTSHTNSYPTFLFRLLRLFWRVLVKFSELRIL